jgi:hypothetical protein
MNAPLFDIDDIMRDVRAAADLASPATVATLLQSEPTCSKVAVVAASSDARGAAREVRGCPPGWVEAIDRLTSKPCPDGFAPQRWAVLCRGVECFAQQWAEKAISLGWTFEELFAFREPFANVSRQGAGWFIGDSTVTAVTADAITLRTYSGSTLRSYRKTSPRDEKLEAAVAFLKAELADGGWHSAYDLEAAASDVGITRETLARARARLGVESRQAPGCPRKWRLPDAGAAR